MPNYPRKKGLTDAAAEQARRNRLAGISRPARELGGDGGGDTLITSDLFRAELSSAIDLSGLAGATTDVDYPFPTFSTGGDVELVDNTVTIHDTAPRKWAIDVRGAFSGVSQQSTGHHWYTFKHWALVTTSSETLVVRVRDEGQVSAEGGLYVTLEKELTASNIFIIPDAEEATVEMFVVGEYGAGLGLGDSAVSWDLDFLSTVALHSLP